MMMTMQKMKPAKQIVASRSWRQQGLSLVELMIAISLGLFLIWGVTQSFLTSRQSYRLQQGVGRIQENGRLAQEFLGFDIRNAGDYGCGSGDDFVWANFALRNDCTVGAGTAGINMIGDTTFATTAFEYSVYGYDDVSAGTAISDGNTINLSKAALAGTDVLMLRLTEDLGSLTAAVGDFSTATLLSLTAGPGFNIPNMPVNTLGLPVMPANQAVAISDCATTKIVAINSTSAGDTTVSLSGGTTNSCTYARFQQGASVRKLSTVYYFVAASVSGTTTSLYRQMGEGVNAEELLEGVEDMQLQFGLDINGDSIVDSWEDAVDVTPAMWNGWDWDNGLDGIAGTSDDVKESNLIRAVRYSLLLVTDEPVLGEAQTLVWKGAATNFADRRLRQVFSSSVGIRSRFK